jgi:hypothetical protein
LRSAFRITKRTTDRHTIRITAIAHCIIGCRLTLPVRGLDVDDRRAVQRLQRGHAQPHGAVRAGHQFQQAHLVQAHGVGPGGGAGVEHPASGALDVAARMHGQHVAVGAVQPGEQGQ